jgi:hypothetical protein
MATRMVAGVTCPRCQGQFQARVESVVDVKKDPSAKARVMNGAVNLATCPQCGSRVMLQLPFLYHDPDKELALIYAPMAAGQDEAARQKAIGQLTKTAMDSLPPAERKGYLLQPQEFLTLDNLIKRVLEAEGITEEVIADQREKAELLQKMADEEDAEALDRLIKENDEGIDPIFLRMLAMSMEVARANGRREELDRLLQIQERVLQLSTEGQAAARRAEMVEQLRQEPKGEKLLELLIEAPDEAARSVLVSFGLPLVDYAFFSVLTSRIDSAADEKEKKRLTELRSEVLHIRDQIESETRALLQQRAALLRDLMLSDDPAELARRRIAELDDAFFQVVAANMEEARTGGDEKALQALQAIWALALGLLEQTLPPAVRLFNRLVAAEEEDVVKLLEKNQRLVTPEFVGFLEQAEQDIREDGSEEAADHLAMVLAKARERVGKAEEPKDKPKGEASEKAPVKKEPSKKAAAKPRKAAAKKKPAAKKEEAE